MKFSNVKPVDMQPVLNGDKLNFADVFTFQPQLAIIVLSHMYVYKRYFHQYIDSLRYRWNHKA